MSKNKYPIGATWELKKNGMIAHIWLGDISEFHEIWRWSICYSDGSGLRFDWRTSYRGCKDEIPISGRFKRIK